MNEYFNYVLYHFITVRKSIQDKFPIIRADKDIETLITKPVDDITSIFEMFVKYSPNLHAFRAVEPGAIFHYNEFMFCPPGDAYRNASVVENDPSIEGLFTFGDISFTERCLNELAKDNFESVAIGSRSMLAKLIFESGV